WRDTKNVQIEILAPSREKAHVIHRHVEVFTQEVTARRIEDGARPAVERLLFDLPDAAPNRRFAVNFDLFPNMVVDLLQDRVVMGALFGMHHALFEIEQLGRGDLDTLDTRRRAMAVGPQITGKNITEKVPFHDLVVLNARRQAILALELGVGLGVVPTRVN